MEFAELEVVEVRPCEIHEVHHHLDRVRAGPPRGIDPAFEMPAQVLAGPVQPVGQLGDPELIVQGRHPLAEGLAEIRCRLLGVGEPWKKRCRGEGH